MKTILVTGCCGMIGFATVKKLLQKNYQVIGVDNFETLNDTNHLHQKKCLIKLSENKKFIYLNTDITLPILKLIIDLPKQFKPNLIIHLAAKAGITYSLQNPANTLYENQQGLVQALEIARHLDLFSLFASSSSVYGNQDQSTIENIDLNPLSIYALTKKQNEDIAKMYYHLYGVGSIGLRFFTVYGPYNRADMLVHKIFQSIVQNKELTLHNNGLMKRSFTFNADIAEILTNFVSFKLNHPEKEFNVFNIGNNENINLLKFISLFELYMNKKANIILSLDKPQHEPDITYCNNDKIMNKFPDTLFSSFESGVEQTVQWYKKFYTY